MTNTELALSVYKKYRSVYPEVSYYHGIVANYGLLLLAEQAGDGSEEDALIREVLASFPDHVKHCRYNFPSYAICGNAKARALWDGVWTDAEQVRPYAEEMMTAQRDADGIMGMPAPKPRQRVWIDVATAVTPFLLFSGLALEEMRYVDEAAKQTLMMYDLFRDPENGLLHQSRDFCGEGKLSEDHWSRGNGWGAFPLAELCAHLPDGHPEKARAISYFQAHMQALLPYQSERGMWRQEITVAEDGPYYSYEETSGTGLILYAMSVGLRLGILDEAAYRPALTRGIAGLKQISIAWDYSINNSCPGCLCPGDGTIRAYLSHRRPYPNEPHGAGPVIMALAGAAACGLKA